MSTEMAVKVFRTLESKDIRTLTGLELSMSRHEYAPAEEIAKFANLLLDETRFRLRRLHRMGLIRRASAEFLGYEGYTINYVGYDCLALNYLVKSGVVEAIGKPLGVGKEADVYDALSPRGRRIAIKFHRLGRVSFRQTRRARGYVAERRHISWLYQSRLAAEREYQALKLVYPRKVAVPKPIAQNRHAIVTSFIDGVELNQYVKVPKPRIVLRDILSNVRKAYLEAGVIHADLSEFNVLLKPSGRVLIIDWPQYITRDHPNAWQILVRDVKNVLTYFRRKFDVKLPLEEALSYVKGDKRRLTY
jgi:RIO kinase 2